jgi:anaerobic selenocysteine-containing dehydrogenase
VTEVLRTYCSLCGVGCPAAIAVEGQRVLSLAPDREHPDGGTVCAKGRAAPEMHDHSHRVNHPLRRTAPKTAPDPAWEQCSWDEALDTIADRLLAIQSQSGSHAVAIGRGTGSGTGLSPTEPWVKRFAAAFGTPNYMTNTHLCNWPRDGASHYTFGVYPLPMPDVARSGCIVLWGSNPSATLLNLANGVLDAKGRGAKLVVVDPRRVGLGNRADLLLQVRPGTDGALALAFIHELIEHEWFDRSFVTDWTNAPFLVCDDTGRLLRSDEVAADQLALDGGWSGESGFVFVDERTGRPTPSLASNAALKGSQTQLRGSVILRLRDGGSVRCRTVFDLLAEEAGRFDPAAASRITGVPEGVIRDAVRLIAEHRPVSHHTWNGVVQHTNASQASRAIEVFYALLGDWDLPGGNLTRPAPRTRDIGSGGGPSTMEADLRLGAEDRPLGPPSAPPGNIAAYDLFTAVLEERPYRIRALLSFGGNTLLNSGDPRRGREAFERLEFFAQAELFHTPTSRYADVLLPAAGFLESDVLMITNDGMAQRRRRVVQPLYDRRPDVNILFDLAKRLGLGDRFSGGDVKAAYDDVLSPAGLSFDGLLEHPNGVRVSPEVRYATYAETDVNGRPRGFDTPSGKVELFVDAWAEHGQAPLPTYEEPVESSVRTPDLARDYPLVLTNAKRPQYLHSQHRGVAALRRVHPDPTVEIHPETATRHGVVAGRWVWIETPRGRSRAVVDVTETIAPGVVCASHGWWEGCEELGLEPLDPFDEQGANVNLLVHNDVHDPISGSLPHRSSLCRVRLVDAEG